MCVKIAICVIINQKRLIRLLNINKAREVCYEDEKKQIVLNLINNPDFQKKCCEIMSCDMKRNINADDTLKALDQLFNFGKYIDEFIEAGIGCDHEYRIE